MDDSNVIPVTIQPKNIYGLRSEVVGNIHFTANQEVIYPVEGVLAFHDYVANKQKFLRLPENTDAGIICLSPNRRFLAVLEVCRIIHQEAKKSYELAIYDTTTLKKRRVFVLPEGNDEKLVLRLAFTHDSKGLVALTQFPEETVFYFMFDKLGTVLHGRAANNNQRGFADCIACNPQDTGMIAVAGENHFKLMSKSEKGFTVSANVRTDGVRITSMTWLSMDMLMAGTNKGEIWFIENGELKNRSPARSIEVIDLMREQDVEETGEKEEDAANVDLLNPAKDTKEECIVCMISFPRGVAFAIFNEVFVFEKQSKFRYERKTILNIPIDIYPEEMYQITNMAINHQQDTVIVTAKHSQIYVGVLIVPESLKTKYLKFCTLGVSMHIDSIIDISMCSWKPIIMTASKDQTIRIWNYETEKVELVKKYQVDVTVIELSPTGLFAAVGFADQLRIMEIFIDDLRIIKTYNFPRCKDVRYSNLGHLMAAAYDNLIAITSVFNFEVVRKLKGHNGDVLSVAWSRNDKILVSGGIEGAIYQWDVDTGNRIYEVVQKGIEYRSLVVTNDPLSIYAVTNLGTMREILKSEVVREIKPPSNCPLSSITLSRSDMVLFMSTENGHLYNVQLPFLDAGGGNCYNYRFFDSSVNKVCVSFDGTLLVTASRSGTLGIWVLKNIDGRVAPYDQDLLQCQEVLIARNVLHEKFETISNLEVRLQQQAAEFHYQLSQNEAFDEAQMADIHRSYCQAIEELKQKNNEMDAKHVEQLNQITTQINEIKNEHKKELANLSSQYSERMLMEYQKFASLRDSMVEMRESYEDKLRKSAGSLQDTIEALETDFKKQLHERQELIRKLMLEMEDKKIEFVEYCRQVETDNDRNMVETQFQYEKKLKDEQDSTLKWRGEAGVLKKKFASMSKEADDLRDEVENLKEEHHKNQKEIERLLRTTDDLRKEIEEREYAINDKEKRIQEVLHKNQELEKYKQVLNHKISELKAQIEPRERQIKEKRNQIAEMERELEGLHNSNLSLELQLNELKDKYISNTAELQEERKRSRQARNFISQICTDIYNVSANINRPDLLQEGIKKLFQRYSEDQELKKAIILDAQVQSEFQRQREHIEHAAANCKRKLRSKNDTGKSGKLIAENLNLLNEIAVMRKQLAESAKAIQNLEIILGVGGKNASNPAARARLKDAVKDIERIEESFKHKITTLEEQVTTLTTENLELRGQLQAKPRPKPM